MMKILKNKALWLAGVLVVVAIYLNFQASTYPLRSSTIDVTSGGQTVTKDVIEMPVASRVLNLAAVALYGVATAILIL